MNLVSHLHNRLRMKNCYYLLICLTFILFSCEETKSDEPVGKAADIPIAQPAQDTNTNPGLTEDYINTNRVIWQKPDMIINMLGDLADKTVVDIGAGTGYFSLKLAQQAKKVIAVDIDPRFTNYLDSVKVLELPETKQNALETRLATPSDPRLNESEADLAVVVNTYMYFDNRTKYLKTLREGISEGGKILIVDFKKKRTPIGPPSTIRIPLYKVEEELYGAGFKNVKTYDTALDYQYILIAER